MLRGGESISKDLARDDFERFRDYITTHAGIFLEANKSDALRISLLARSCQRGCGDLDSYYHVLTSDDEEFNELLNLVTINETSFFRFPAQFEALRTRVVADILKTKPKASRAFRAWSAGCSTGEEPYSIAMTLLDSDLGAAGYRIEVLGTDVSTQALDKGRDAVYPARAVDGLDQRVLERFFEPNHRGLRVVRNVRSRVDLGYHNLVKEPYPLSLLGNWDVIFCRNVTIYFRTESTRRVVNNFYESLNPGGYLFIGHSETLTAVSDRFEPIELDGLFVYRKPVEQRSFTLGMLVGSRGAQATGEDTGDDRTGGAAVAEGQSPLSTSGSTGSGTRSEDGTAAVGATGAGVGVEREEDVLVRELLAQAHRALDEGSPSRALEIAREALRSDSKNVDAYLICAYAHADEGNYTSAVVECHHALAIDPLGAAARYILGVIYQRLDEPSRAIDEFRRTLYVDSNFVLAHFGLANLYRARGAFSDAAREYESTLRSVRTSPEGTWTGFMGGFAPDLLVKTCERGLAECRRAVANG